MDPWNFREPASAWTHLIGLVLALVGSAILVRKGGNDLGKRISLVVYSLCLVACYAASTLYHGVRLPPEQLGPYIRLDKVGIFALIAGTYTPLAWVLLSGPWRIWTLATIWGIALGSIAMIATGRQFSSVVGTCIYLGMGWGAVVCYARIARIVSHRALSPIALGGVAYSVGAVLNLIGWPVLWKGVFGTHDLFHLFVMLGSVLHYVFILRIIVPYVPPIEPDRRAGDAR